MKTRTNTRRTMSRHHTNIESIPQDSAFSSSHSKRRSSKRIQNMQKLTASPGQIGLADSAYDADEESVTPNSSPDQHTEQIRDPYEMDMTDDDVSAVKTKQRRKKDQRKVTKQPAIKKQKKSQSSLPVNKKQNPTSTPVLHSSNESQSLSGTPEVTPILPYKTHQCASQSDDSFATPQIHRPSKKRSLQPDSLTSLSYSTPGDSGIALSPVSKKHRSTSDAEKHTADLQSRNSMPHKKITMPMKVKKEQKHTASVCGHLEIKHKNIFRPVTEMNVPDVHKRVNFNKQAKSVEDSCFGFDSLMSPLITTENSPPAKPRRLNNSKKIRKSISSKDAYRLKCTNSSDSSETRLTNEPMLSLDSESSQENLPRTKSASPTLFSDFFSADSESLEMEVNKSADRVYKPSKVRRIKEKTNVSRLDVWATNFNMEIEDIEKFDLNIE